MVVSTGSGSPNPLSSTGSLSSSMSEFPMHVSDAANGQVTAVMMTQREWRNTTAPLEQRYARAITVLRYAAMTENSGMMTTASEGVLQGQRRVVSNEMWLGLEQLKSWVNFHVHRIVVPPQDPRQLAISQSTPANPFCVTMSSEGCGVRNYLQAVCKELRIDFYRVGGSYWEEGMMEDMIDAASRSRRALILFDRCSWFSHAHYASRGASFMHHLRAAMHTREAMAETMAAAHGSAVEITNSWAPSGLATLLPNLWIVISSSSGDVVPEVLEMANGCTYRLFNASPDTALAVVRMRVAERAKRWGFEPAEVEETLSESTYTAQLQQIAHLLANAEVGAIVSIIEAAITIAYERDLLRPMHGTSLVALLPMAVDVQQAINRLSGQSVGGAAAVLATTPTTMAAKAAASLNGKR